MPEDLLTRRQMAEAERLAIDAGTPAAVLMERAGAAVAQACLSFAGERVPRVAVLCGPGNNGGDGYVVARLLREAGWPVCCFALGDFSRSGNDAREASRRWTGDCRPASQFEGADASLIVDALFGTGLSRELTKAARDLVRAANRCGAPIVSIDIPSGIDGDTGAAWGDAIDATTTVTFARAKHGHYLYPGAAHCGCLIVADIGIDAFIPAAAPRLRINGPDTWTAGFPWPRADGHKYKRGHAVVVSGGLSHTGASRLSARAALRIGAGLVTLASPTDALAVNAAHLTAIMLRRSDGPDGLGDILADARKNAVILGPGLGLGASTRALVEAALTNRSLDEDAPRRHVLLDADALTSFEKDAQALARLIAASRGSVVITPHDGEFARLFTGEPSVLDAGSKVERARAAAQCLGCVVLLKGPDTVVADPGGEATIAAEAAPWLATAGSGDVLSGLIGGLLAQGVPAFDAANIGAYLHGAAGRRFGPGLIAEDLPDAIPGALRDLQGLSRT